MQRVLSTVTLLGLLVATAAAFAITEHLKQIKSPLYATAVTRLISPVCRCDTATATIGLELRHADALTVTIQGSGGHTVATLAERARYEKGFVEIPWHGRTDAGGIAPDGTYRPQIQLGNGGRTILLPNKITIDTVAPKVLAASVQHPVFSPAGNRTVSIHYAFSEPAHVAVYLNGRRIIRGHATKAHRVNWNGKENGRAVPAGRYVLSVGAVDAAGNATPAAQRKSVAVVVRYVALTRGRIVVRPGARFTVGVETGAARYSWRLGGRRGTSKAKLLRLRAPSKHGSYRLVVGASGHSAAARVIVGRG